MLIALVMFLFPGQIYWFDVQIVNCIGNIAFSRLGNATRGP